MDEHKRAFNLKTLEKTAAGMNIDKDLVIDPDSCGWFHPGVSKVVRCFFGPEVLCCGGFRAMRKPKDESDKVIIPAQPPHQGLRPGEGRQITTQQPL